MVIHSCTPRRLASSHVLMHSWRQFNPLLLSWGRAAYYSTDIKRSVCLRGRYIRRIAAWKFRSHWEEIIGGLWMSSTVFISNLWGFPFMARLLNGANWICTSTKEWKGKLASSSWVAKKSISRNLNLPLSCFRTCSSHDQSDAYEYAIAGVLCQSEDGKKARSLHASRFSGTFHRN